MKKNHIFFSTIKKHDINVNRLIRAKDVQCIKKGKHSLSYIQLHCGFDIETSTIGDRAYMYIWQMSINGFVIFGRHWDEFIELLDMIIDANKLTKHKRCLIWIANLSFEMQFMRKWLAVTDVFAKKERHPMYVIHKECIEFRDALLISGGSLADLAKKYTTTQKAVNDLDYDLIRTDKSNLSEKEIGYCANDVIILSEFSEYIWETFVIPHGFIPLTATQILRDEVTRGVPDVRELKQKIFNLTCGEHFYRFMIQYLYRGGYTHANIYAVGQVINDIISFDITSSYPWAMVSGMYPMSQFAPIKFNEKNLKTYSCIIIATFTNIKSTTNHSIESKSKCIELEGEVIDNGRVSSADKMTVCLTELDYKTYTEFYKWDSIDVIECLGAHKGKLPRYVVNPMIDHYMKKSELKRSGLSGSKEYAIEKGKVNSFYGMMVTRMVDSEITYVDNEWKTETGTLNYEKARRNLILSPFWGVWVCAIARRNLLSLVFEIGNDNIYNDTDSLYAKWSKRVIDIINKRNVDIKKQQISAFEHYNIDSDLCGDLGLFDYDGLYDFKTLGAKRYVKRNVWSGKVSSTIAGLPKKYFAGKPWQEVVNEFTDQMYVEHAYKLRAIYNDNEHGEKVTGYDGIESFMFEKSSVALVENDFTLRMDAIWMELILEILKEKGEYKP